MERCPSKIGSKIQEIQLRKEKKLFCMACINIVNKILFEVVV